MTKVDEKIIAVTDVAVPKEIIFVPVSPVVLKEIAVIETEIKKSLQIKSTEQLVIKTVEVSKNTYVPIYEVVIVDQSGAETAVEVVYNSNTNECVVVDVKEGKFIKAESTVTEVKAVSGVTEITTTNTQTIKESREFKQIISFLIKNHPKEEFETAIPVV